MTTTMTTTTMTEEQLRHRIEYLTHREVLECPNWCLKVWDEDQWEVHYGPWESVLTGAGEDSDVTVWARPVRGWWDADGNQDADSLSSIDIAVTNHPDHSSNIEPLPAGLGFLGSTLNGDELGDLCEGLTAILQKAELADGSQWVWAFPGAEDLADDDSEGDD